MSHFGDSFGASNGVAIRTARRLPRTCLLVAAVLAAIAIGSNLPAFADVIGQAQVVDGDTLQIAGERVRLHGIDAPESRQSCSLSGVGWPCGQNAKRVLTGVIDGRVVTCRGDRRDRYGRLIAVCYIGTDDLNARMVRDGWALAYRRYAPDYVPQETEARAAGSGIWQGQFLEPWEWRRQRRAEPDAAR
jgi:endonuclease YncB( thermonuclease family)